jgi:hypothetical protein
MLFRSKYSQDTLDYLAQMIAKLKPGERINVPRSTLADIGSYNYNGATFTPPDQVLENIMGSSGGWGYDIDPIDGKVIFWRREHREGDAPTYRSPDRRGQNPWED